MTRTARLHAASLVASVWIATACGGGTEPPRPVQELSQEARSHLEQVLGLMQANSIKRLEIDWNDFRARVFAAAAGAQTISGTYEAIRTAIGLLGDGHSSYRTSTGATIFVPTRTCNAVPIVTAPTLPGTIGYVRVRSFSGTAQQAVTFATSIQEAIKAADRDDLIGWIVDLRGNGGGNMWPMLAGVGPVLGEGVAGYFIDPVGAEKVWEYEQGASRIDGVVVTQVEAPYRLRRESPRVAVLIDNWVASSGEAAAIAFKQRPATRFFGTPTCGLSTANAGFPLSDGALLILTVSTMADRTRQSYGQSVAPDESIADPTQLVQRAVAWLESGA